MSRKYVIINTGELDSLDFNQLKTTSKNTARRNVDDSQVIVSYEGTTPSVLVGKTEYTNNQLCAIINNIDNGWFEEDE